MIISLRRVRLLRTDLCFWPNDHSDGEVADNNRSLHRNLEKWKVARKTCSVQSTFVLYKGKLSNVQICSLGMMHILHYHWISVKAQKQDKE